MVMCAEGHFKKLCAVIRAGLGRCSSGRVCWWPDRSARFMNVRLGNGLPSLIASLLFFAVVGKPLSSGAASSSRPGMGSIPYSGGVTFRVWAPNATKVTVEGTFNGFSTTATPLFSEVTNGNWSVDVSGPSLASSTSIISTAIRLNRIRDLASKFHRSATAMSTAQRISTGQVTTLPPRPWVTRWCTS